MPVEPIKHVLDDITLSESCCAKVFAALYPDLFRYEGGTLWKYYEKEGAEWKEDKNQVKLRKHIKTDFCGMILQRAKFWQDYSQQLEVPHHDIAFRIRCMMDLVRKLQNDRYVGHVIREMAEWYNYE